MEVKRMKVKVCLVGEAAVGKTSLIRRFVLENFDDKYIQTLGTKVSKKELTSSSPDGSGELKIDMTIWDIMGQKGFRELLKEAYFYGARGILALCDRKSTRLNSSHVRISYAVFCLKKKKNIQQDL